MIATDRCATIHVWRPSKYALRCTRLTDATARHRVTETPTFTRYRQTVALATSGAEKSVIVVGAGWAGLGAAYQLAKQGYKVTLIDGAANPGGLSAGWRTQQGRAVEAGIKGFWLQYHNIFKLIKELDIEWPLTPLTRTGFWTPKVCFPYPLHKPVKGGCSGTGTTVLHALHSAVQGAQGYKGRVMMFSAQCCEQGLITESPVFSQQPRLPTLLGQFVYTFSLFRTISPLDRAELWRMLLPFLEYNATPDAYRRYDAMSAADLFRVQGVQGPLYDDFLEPLMLVLLFAPPRDLSAGAVMSALYYLCMSHQNDFDVAWCRGSIAERIFQPLLQQFTAWGGMVRGQTFVTDIQTDSSGAITHVVARTPDGSLERLKADAVILAIGVTGLQKLVQSCPAMATRKEFCDIMALRAVDVISTRWWLDRKLQFKFASNCIAGFKRDVGGTFYHLNDLQDEYRDEPCSVVAFDLYNAATLMPLPDDQLLQRLLSQLQAIMPEARGAKVLDNAVLRFPKAVTHFSPGSYAYRPTQRTSFPNLFLAGDMVKGVPHGAKGLSQERAYVTGLLAANMVVQHVGVGSAVDVVPVEPDEPHVALGKQAVRQAQLAFKALGL